MDVRKTWTALLGSESSACLLFWGPRLIPLGGISHTFSSASAGYGPRICERRYLVAPMRFVHVSASVLSPKLWEWGSPEFSAHVPTRTKAGLRLQSSRATEIIASVGIVDSRGCLFVDPLGHVFDLWAGATYFHLCESGRSVAVR